MFVFFVFFSFCVCSCYYYNDNYTKIIIIILILLIIIIVENMTITVIIIRTLIVRVFVFCFSFSYSKIILKFIQKTTPNPKIIQVSKVIQKFKSIKKVSFPKLPAEFEAFSFFFSKLKIFFLKKMKTKKYKLQTFKNF